MKMTPNRFLKLIISICYLGWQSLKSFVKKTFSGKIDTRFLILYYHSVPENLKDEFIWQLNKLEKYGMLIEIDSKITDKEPGRYYAISFDDGLKSVLDNAYPELEKRNIPHTIFFPTSYIGKVPDWKVYDGEMEQNDRVITDEEIKRLNLSIIKVGSHTVNHPKLTKISAENQLIELNESKKYLEDLIHSSIEFISVPYGDYDRGVIQRSREAGYKMLFSTEPKYVSNNGIHHDIRGRIAVGPTNTRSEFIVKVLGGYNWITSFIKLKKNLKKIFKIDRKNQNPPTLKKYSVKEVTDKSIWYDALKEFSDANIYQTWNFSVLAQGEKCVKHYAVYDNDAIVGMAQVRLRTAPVINRGIAYIYRGPIWQKKDQPSKRETLYSVLHALREELVVNQKHLLRARPAIFSDQFTNIDLVTTIGFEKREKFQPYHSLVLDLEQSLEDIRKGFNRKWRNNLNQSGKKGLEIKEGRDPELFQELLKTFNVMAERKKFKQFVDVEKMGAMNKVLDEEFKLKIYIVYKDGEPITSFATSTMGDTAIAMFGGSTKLGLENKATYLVQWRAIQWFKEVGCKRYDLGGINLKLNPNGYIFKSGITKNEVFGMGVYEACDSLLSKFLVRLGEKFYKK